MFKHCLSKFSCALVMMCALVTGGLLQSCEDLFDLDDYKYDDSEPSWLGPSIYEFLKTGNAGHTYTNYVKLIEDLDQKEILSRTGSRTMFVADDASFEKFYNSDNAWNVKSYEDFTPRQKKVLLYNVMLKNAYLLDMLALVQSSPTTEQTGGDCLRRETMATLYDSVPVFTNDELTVNGDRNVTRFPQNNEPFDYYRDYLANSGKTNIRVALGNKNPMLVHFLYEYVRTNNILDSDFEVLFNYEKTNKRRVGTEGFIYSSKIVKSDVSYGDLSDDTLTITCKNGYLYRMDDVLLPPSNMAQVLRETENTKIFSRLIDRFAYLEYNEDITKMYNANEHEGKPEENENVYLLKYALKNSADAGQVYYTPNESGLAGKNVPYSVEKFFDPNAYLKFDPGESQYNSGNGVQRDMAALLVPTDEMIYRFFAPKRYQSDEANEEALKLDRPYGAGASILEEYCNTEDLERLYESNIVNDDYASVMHPCLDSVPLNIIAAFVNNLMQKSFLNTLPSNFAKVRDDARDEMGLTEDDVEDCIIANNGVIYILNNVYGPAKYQSVMTPPIVMENMLIMRTAINELRYESYLLAMKSTFSLIVPDDSNFTYYDASTFKSPTPKAYRFTWGKVRQTETTAGLIFQEFVVDPVTYEVISKKDPVKSSFGTYKAIFDDLLEYFVIVDSVESDYKDVPMNQYYLTKGYGMVKCTKDEEGNIRFQGGEQLELSRRLGRDVYVTVQENGRYEEKNGVTYSTEGKDENYKSGVVSPPTKSVYSYFTSEEEGNPFYKFGEICMSLSEQGLYENIFGLKSASQAFKDTIDKYRIFSNERDFQKVYDQAIPFFSKYHYTVYVPQPSALEEAFELGIPTPDDINAELEAGNNGRAAAMVRMLNKFIRYHFQDNSVMVDVLPFSAKLANGGEVDTARYETSVINEKTGRFFDLLVKTDNGEYGQTLTVTDDLGNVAYVMNKDGEEGITWNLLSRDVVYSKVISDKANMSWAAVENSSFAVIHQIDKVLYNSNLFGYDGKIQRYAKDGEPVEEIEIAVPVNYDEANDVVTYANETYRVGKAKTFKVTTGNGVKNMGTYYLMRGYENSDNKFEQEDYIRTGEDEKVLITDAGHLVGLDKSNKLRYLWTDLQPLSVNEKGEVAYPDSIVTVLPLGTFVDAKGKVIE